MTTATVKRGDTFSAQCQRVGVDITATTIRSQIRAGSWVQELTVTKTNAATGEFTLSATAALHSVRGNGRRPHSARGKAEDVIKPTVGFDQRPAVVACKIRFNTRF